MPALLAPPIHVRFAPPLDPPYDDEAPLPAAPAPSPVAQPHLPLDWSPQRLLPTARAETHAAPSGPAAAAPEYAGPQRATATRRPSSPARGAAMHFLSLCLEVLNGYRPPTHLRPLTAPSEFDGIAEQIARALKRVSSSARSAPPRPPRAALPNASPARSVPRVRLRELRVCEPRAGIAEAAAVLGHGGRVWALALRLERRPAGWLCTVAHLI